MPIAYSCPHCGKQYSVADQYAGQTGPCAACGQPITIPLPGYSRAPPPTKTGGGVGIAVAAVIVCVVGGICVVGILVALILPAFFGAQEAARRMQGSNHLKQLALAMQNYHDQYNVFPPAVVTDASGKPLYSGRVLLLPFLEQEALYAQFDKTQAWDSPANRAISQQHLQFFTDPSARERILGQTDFVFVTGTGTAFDPPTAYSGMAKILDGTSNTMFMVEIKNSGINWAEPRDLDISQPMSLPPGNHPNVNMAVFFDGHTGAISKNVAPQTVRALATCAGGEQIGDY